MHAFIIFLILTLLVLCRIAYSMKEGLDSSTDNTTTLGEEAVIPPSTDNIIDYSNPIRVEAEEEEDNPIDYSNPIIPSPPPPPPPPQDNNPQISTRFLKAFINSFYHYFKKDENGDPLIAGSIEDESLRFIFEPPQGATGPPGPIGLKGDKGDQGLKGDKGDQGLKGDKGDQGLKGDKGNKGDTGDAGANVFDFSKIMLNGDSFKRNNKGEKDNPPEPVPAHSTLFS